MRNPWPGPACVALLVVVAGCLGGSEKPASTTPPPTTEPGANDTFEDPVADFFASPNPVLAGESVRFDASTSMDPEGGNLSYVWDFGDDAVATGLNVEHTFAAPGSFRVALNVTSDVSQHSNEAALNIRVLDPATIKQPLVVSDPEGDATLDQGDHLRATVFDDGRSLLLSFALADVSDQFATLSPVMIDFTLNDAPYEVYGLAGQLHVYDFGSQGDVPGAEVQVDASANLVFVSVPFPSLGSLPPYEVYFETRIGEPVLLHGQVTDDRAPDTGTATYPG